MAAALAGVVEGNVVAVISGGDLDSSVLATIPRGECRSQNPCVTLWTGSRQRRRIVVWPSTMGTISSRWYPGEVATDSVVWVPPVSPSTRKLIRSERPQGISTLRSVFPDTTPSDRDPRMETITTRTSWSPWFLMETCRFLGVVSLRNGFRTVHPEQLARTIAMAGINRARQGLMARRVGKTMARRWWEKFDENFRPFMGVSARAGQPDGIAGGDLNAFRAPGDQRDDERTTRGVSSSRARRRS